MNRMLLFTLLLIGLGGVSTANAQISEGNVMIGTDVSNLNVSFNNQTTFQLTPKAAWFIQDGLAVGGYAQFGITHVNGSNGSNYTYGVGPLARYFFIKDGIPAFRSAKFFFEGNAGFQGVNSTVSRSTTNGLGFGAGPGISYFITPSIGLEGLLKYNGIVGFGSNTYSNGLSFSIGFQVYLPSKKLIKQIEEF